MEYVDQTWRIFFEALPVIAAFITMLLATRRALTSSHLHSRRASTGFAVSAAILIVAQTSWSWTLFIQKDVLGTEFANILWTMFNLVSMISMAYAVQWAARK